MQKKAVRPATLEKPTRYNLGVTFGELVFTAGITGNDPLTGKIVEGGIGPSRDRAIGMEELVEEAVQHMTPLALAANLDLQTRLPDERLPTIMGDRERLFRVLVNLIDNSIKFTTQGQVVVSVQLKDGLAEVAVVDTGRGIEPHVLEHVFDRFYQEKSQAEGVGIGLTICKAVIEAHGGRIWGESAGKGRGATFRFALPLESRGREA